MGTMQDQLNAHKEGLEVVTAASNKQIVNGEVVEDTIKQQVASPPAPAEADEDKIADIIRARIVRVQKRIQEFVATRNDRDTGLRQRRDRLEKNEVNLRDLYREKPEVEKLLQEEVRKLAEAKKAGLTHDVPVLQEGVQALTEDFADITRTITTLETRYPELKGKLDEEQRVITAHQRFLERFAKEVDGGDVVQYTAKRTPTPGVDTIKAADIFLETSIKEASAGQHSLIVLSDSTTTSLFVSGDGRRWVPKYPQLLEGIEVCRELTDYADAVHAAKQRKLQQWADKDVEAGLLLTPQIVAQQKNDPQNRHHIVNMVRTGNGFCFVPVMSKKSTTLAHYCAMPSEIKVEYGNPEGTKRHMLRVTAVTTPQFVEDIFFPEEGNGIAVMPTFYFDDLHEISTWRRINPVVRDSLTNAVRWAEGKEKEIAVMEELGNVSAISDLRTIHQLADSAVGTAVIHAPRSRYGNGGFAIGFQMVSDGVTVRPGLRATDRSKKLPVYEEILDGKPVTEFFARKKDGSFVNEELQELAVRNEAFELGWLVPSAATVHNAERVCAENIAAMIMPDDKSGTCSTYVFHVSVAEKHRGKEETTSYHEVAYVVACTDNALTFVTGLTPYSISRLIQQGFALGTPYNLGELKGYILHVFQRLYCRVMDVAHSELPENLRVGRAKVQGPTQEKL